MKWLVAFALGAYLLAFRVYGVNEGFALLGEQVRDWSIAQRSFDNLPWVGPRSPNSGLDIGPVYYPFLWASRVVLGPFFDYLPHAGAWALAIAQTVADLALFVALWRVFNSGWAAGAVVIGAATGVLGAHLTTTIWNPPLAVAFVKFGAAAALWRSPLTSWTFMATLACGALALQAHPSTLMVLVPLAFVGLWNVGRHHGIAAIWPGLVAVTILSLPWALAYQLSPVSVRALPEGQTGAVLGSVAAVVSDPLSRLRIGASADGIARSLEHILGHPFSVGWLRWVLLGCALATLVKVRDSVWNGWTAGSLITAVAMFSFWQGYFDSYWFLVLAPAAAACLAAPILMTSGRLRVGVIVVCVILVAAVQPWRARELQRWRYPEYGVLVRATRAIASTGTAVREIRTSFQIPEGMDVYFLHALQGGRLDADGPIATIAEDGSFVLH